MHASKLLLAAVLAALLTSGLHAEEAAKAVQPPAPPTIELAICLDVSGSMKGLVDSARAKIWSIVNDLALAKPTPRLRVALLSFGHQTYPEADGWVRVESNLTDDLDLISQKLFALTLNGGNEYVGRVMQRSLDELTWSKDAKALKIMIVAGNEGADQDQKVNYREVSKRAIASGIMVNTIYCGSPADQIAPGWKEAALLADGHFATIDQNRGTVNVATPFDARIVELSTALNATYIPLGTQGKKGLANQSVQDRNAQGLSSSAAAGRALSKSSKLYNCSWCLVDAVRTKQIDLTKVDKKDLPKELQDKTPEQIQAILDKKYAERQKIQKEIQEINTKRAAFVTGEMKKKSLTDARAFDAAIRKSIRSQAASKGYAFTEETK